MYYPFRRTIAGVRGDISLLFSPFLFLLYCSLLFIFTALLSFLCLFHPLCFIAFCLASLFLSSLSPYLRVYFPFLPCFLYIFLFKPCLCFFL
jgi:hypothetical protein